MKTYLESRLQFLDCGCEPALIASSLGIDDPKSVVVSAGGRLVEVLLSEPESDEEAVMKNFMAWVERHRPALRAITAGKRDFVLKRYVPQNHGYSFVHIPETLCGMATELGFGICIVYVTLWENRTVTKTTAVSEPAPGADSEAHQG